MINNPYLDLQDIPWLVQLICDIDLSAQLALTGIFWHWSQQCGLPYLVKCNQEWCYCKKALTCPNPSSNSQYSWWLKASPHALSKSLEPYVFGIYDSTTGRNDHILVLLWWRKTRILLYIITVKFQKSRTKNTDGCSNHLNLEVEAEPLTNTLSYLNLNTSRTKNGGKQAVKSNRIKKNYRTYWVF